MPTEMFVLCSTGCHLAPMSPILVRRNLTNGRFPCVPAKYCPDCQALKVKVKQPKPPVPLLVGAN